MYNSYVKGNLKLINILSYTVEGHFKFQHLESLNKLFYVYYSKEDIDILKNLF